MSLQMNKFVLHLLLITLPCIYSCHQKSTNPPPTENTIIHKNGEDGESFEARLNWIELMHGGKESGWRQIEAQNQLESYQQWLKNNYDVRSENEYVADGLIYGKWSERGSSNNAGNIMVMTYDPETDNIYATGGGGPIFKGNLYETSWTLVHDKLRFSTDLLQSYRMPQGGLRLISAVSNIPHYSDDDGKTWVSSTGVDATSGGQIYHAQMTKNGTIFFLAKRDYWASIHLYISFDFGVTYKSYKTFSTSDTRNIALTYCEGSDDIFLIEQLGTDESKIFKFDFTNKILQVNVPSSPFGFGENGRANLQAAKLDESIVFYAYNDKNQIFTSKNGGQSWSFVAPIPESPWDMGLYVCPSDPSKMFFGEVDAFRSENSGVGWSRINNWWEYYGDIYNKLHADMMYMREFKDKSGKPFVLIGNHGGLNYTDDYGATTSNLGITGLNVSQYYDVRTYPSDPYYIFAGSQDQGQQRGLIDDEIPSELQQNISGDYGHIEFTGNGKSLWSVYPGGSIGFYSAPKSQSGPIAGYEINSDNETVWIPPIMPGPDPTKNIIIAAGGSVTPSSKGSYLLQLEYKNNEIKATELPFDFSISGGQISAMAIDPFDSNKWYVATTNGQFYKSTDGGQSFIKTASMLSESHYLYGSCILPSATKKDVIYLSGNGYQYKPVYQSLDGGITFKALGSGLPSTMVFNLAANEDESLIFAATEAGPYVYVADRNKWYQLSGKHTPNQTYWSVEYVKQTKTARFATYGRGVWDFKVEEIKTQTNETSSNTNHLNIYPNPTSDYFKISGEGTFKFLQVEIRDISGKMVMKTTSVPNEPINISSLSAGSYLISIGNSYPFVTKKLIKQK